MGSWRSQKRAAGKRLFIGIVLIAAIAAVMGVAIWYQPGGDDDPAAAATNTDPSINTLGIGFQEASRTGDALRGDQPFTIAVLGDATGNEQTEWVYLMANAIAENYQRPVTVHDWSLPDNSYIRENIVGEGGTNPPVVIWNGSASGRDAGYSIEHFETMAPGRPDLVIVNHGHNHTTPEAAVQGINNLLTLATKSWTAPTPALAVVLQNPRTDKSGANQKAKVAALRDDLDDRPDVEIIDVWSAFEKAPSLTPLVRPDGYHPSEQGEILWADTTEAVLGITPSITP